MVLLDPTASVTCTWANVAATGSGAGCSENSSQAFTCANALDGSVGTDWVAAGVDVGAWIKIAFPTVLTVDTVRLRQRDQASDQIKEVRLQFSDCSHEVVSTKRPAAFPRPRSYSGMGWRGGGGGGGG